MKTSIPALDTALIGIGAITAAAWSLKAVSTLYTSVLRSGYDLRKRYQKDDGTTPWAVITGGSDGIGKAFAVQLAQRGFNICLISRTESKLHAVAEEIKAAHGVQVKIVVLDMASSDYDTVKTVTSEAIQGLDVAVLINNAGISPLPQYMSDFSEVESEQSINTISVNVTAFTAVLVAVLPPMKARGVRGGVINVSSSSALHGMPMNAVYAASKGYNNVMSLSLGSEMKQLDVLSFTPLFVTSNMVRRKPSLTVASSEDAAKAALSKLGLEEQTSGVISHQLQNFAIGLFPGMFATEVLRQMRAVRRRITEKVKAKSKTQ